VTAVLAYGDTEGVHSISQVNFCQGETRVLF